MEINPVVVEQNAFEAGGKTEKFSIVSVVLLFVLRSLRCWFVMMFVDRSVMCNEFVVCAVLRAVCLPAGSVSDAGLLDTKNFGH